MKKKIAFFFCIFLNFTLKKMAKVKSDDTIVIAAHDFLYPTNVFISSIYHIKGVIAHSKFDHFLFWLPWQLNIDRFHPKGNQIMSTYEAFTLIDFGLLARLLFAEMR